MPWIRRTWRAAQSREANRYPLIRRELVSDPEFLGSLFEVPALLQQTPSVVGSWTLDLDDRDYKVESIQDLSVLLEREGLVFAAVGDPYGHRCRPERRIHQALLPRERRFILYRELGLG